MDNVNLQNPGCISVRAVNPSKREAWQRSDILQKFSTDKIN